MVPSSTAEVTRPVHPVGEDLRWKRPHASQAPWLPAAAVPAPPLPSNGIRFTSDDLDEVRAEVRRLEGLGAPPVIFSQGHYCPYCITTHVANFIFAGVVLRSPKPTLPSMAPVAAAGATTRTLAGLGNALMVASGTREKDLEPSTVNPRPASRRRRARNPDEGCGLPAGGVRYAGVATLASTRATTAGSARWRGSGMFKQFPNRLVGYCNTTRSGFGVNGGEDHARPLIRTCLISHVQAQQGRRLHS